MERVRVKWLLGYFSLQMQAVGPICQEKKNKYNPSVRIRILSLSWFHLIVKILPNNIWYIFQTFCSHLQTFMPFIHGLAGATLWAVSHFSKTTGRKTLCSTVWELLYNVTLDLKYQMVDVYIVTWKNYPNFTSHDITNA